MNCFANREAQVDFSTYPGHSQNTQAASNRRSHARPRRPIARCAGIGAVSMQIRERKFSMKSALSRVSGLLILLMFAGGIPMTAQRMASLTLPATTGHGSNVYGTATINRFEKQGNQITAIGFVKNSSGTEFQGVRWQLVIVTSSTGTLSATSAHAPAAPQLTRIAWSPGRGNSVKLVPVQAPPPTSCGVLNINLAGASINVAGAQVSLDPITLNI